MVTTSCDVKIIEQPTIVEECNDNVKHKPPDAEDLQEVREDHQYTEQENIAACEYHVDSDEAAGHVELISMPTTSCNIKIQQMSEDAEQPPTAETCDDDAELNTADEEDQQE